MVLVLMGQKKVDPKRKRKKQKKLSKEDKGIVLTTELVGIKNLKTTGNYRLEFDVFEIDTHKVKELIDKLNKAYVMALVECD
jgi:methionine-rich copper-binding protein CopC